MNSKSTGLLIFILALGMMSGLVGEDIKKLHSWYEMTTTEFVGNTLIHYGAVVGAYLGGRLIPTDSMQGGNRKTDPK